MIMSQTWTIQVQDDGVLHLPEEVTDQLGWKSGDVLHWRQIEKGAVSVKRCTEISPMDLSLWFDDYYESIIAGEAYVIASEEGKCLFASVETVLSGLSTVEAQETSAAD
jgi:hypothetical protein